MVFVYAYFGQGINTVTATIHHDDQQTAERLIDTEESDEGCMHQDPWEELILTLILITHLLGHETGPTDCFSEYPVATIGLLFIFSSKASLEGQPECSREKLGLSL